MAHTVAMDLEDEDKDYQEYYGAGMENASASVEISTSPTLPPIDNDPIDHTGIGVYVSGVTAKPVIVENSLWGDPLENINKKQKKDDDTPLCEFHGEICSRGICKVYEKQLREYQKKQREKEKNSQESRNWRNGNGGRNNGRGGAGDRAVTRGRGMLLRGGPIPGRDGPRSSTDGDHIFLKRLV